MIEAIQWFSIEKDDQKIVQKYIGPEKKCKKCKQEMNVHGYIDKARSGNDVGWVVCPGDMIITDQCGTYSPCKLNLFLEMYEPK